jgi:SAM-dependent methyltransferase
MAGTTVSTRPARGVWPKARAPLTDEQQHIAEDWYQYWLELMPGRYSAMERFNHSFPASQRPAGRTRTLEIGAGRGEHLHHEDLAEQEYHCIELRAPLAAEIHRQFPGVTVHVGDCQQSLPYDECHFDRVLAIHVFEHLPDLPAAAGEIHRVLRDDGRLVAVVPCDPGALYRAARFVSAERLFRKRYHQSYEWLIRSEHINSPAEILSVFRRNFVVEARRFFPLGVPSVHANICIGLVLRKA